MNALRALLATGLTALFLSASGCVCCPLKKDCCEAVGCCDTASGRDQACKYYEGCCKPYLPFCVCTGSPCCDTSCGCEVDCCCEADCCCETECCEAECCCEPSCDSCADSCCDDCCETCCTSCKKNCLSCLGGLLGKVFGGCGCGGCDGEMYWNEWHNDPPRCCDPCDKCGNWIGPSTAYRAPYDHPYSR